MLKQNEVAKLYVRAEQARRDCLWPGCSNSAINSHLLQKRGVISNIAENNQLYRLQKNLFTLKMRFEKVGINEALSFKGFCNKHDTEVFREIETNVLDFTSYKSKLLLNYRAIQHNIRKTQVNVDFSERIKAYALAEGDILFASQAKGSIEVNIENQKNYIEHGNLILSDLEHNNESFYFTCIDAPKLDIAASAVHQIETRSDVLNKYNLGIRLFKSSLIFIHLIPTVSNTLIIISCKNEIISRATAIILEARINPVKFVSDTLIKRIETWVCSQSIYFRSFKPQSQRIILESEKYPMYADSDEYISLNIFNKWL